MQRKKDVLAIIIALLFIAVCVFFYAYVKELPATDKTRVEDPYKRTKTLPPSAVPDETSNPALKENK